ncbi:MAG: ATP synthase F1 subunit delta [Defluviitaleaceae bacterium]|nr:ATP synthase F1 subunit delta [Defluviitaleaceae bacterium]
MADLGIRYATALFDISQENGLMDDYLDQAQLVRDNIANDEAQRVLTHPRISSEEKFAFLQKAFENNIHQDLMGFMRLVVTKNRTAFLLSALDKLIGMIKDHKRQTTVRVVSAVPLTDTQAERLTTMLSKKLNKQVDMMVLVDSSVIAGISIQADGYFLDRTVSTMLKDMKENFEL